MITAKHSEQNVMQCKKYKWSNGTLQHRISKDINKVLFKYFVMRDIESVK